MKKINSVPYFLLQNADSAYRFPVVFYSSPEYFYFSEGSSPSDRVFQMIQGDPFLTFSCDGDFPLYLSDFVPGVDYTCVRPVSFFPSRYVLLTLSRWTNWSRWVEVVDPVDYVIYSFRVHPHGRGNEPDYRYWQIFRGNAGQYVLFLP